MDSRKKKIDAEFTKLYTLDQEAFKKLIAEKVERNRMYTKADKQRERQASELAE